MGRENFNKHPETTKKRKKQDEGLLKGGTSSRYGCARILQLTSTSNGRQTWKTAAERHERPSHLFEDDTSPLDEGTKRVDKKKGSKR